MTNWAYDNSGNLTGIPASGGTTVRAACAANVQPGVNMMRTACYDAENRMVSETDASGATSTYTYDGDGRRITKTVSGSTTTFAYDAMGKVVAEYGPANGGSTQYLTGDHLGSTRLVTNASQAVVSTYDYLPFGQEFVTSTDSNRVRFTGKERDSETGLDFFGARYDSAPQGRFTSVDPVFATASLFNPQSWNGYTYTLNNPLKYVDPDGAIPVPFIIAGVGAIVGGVAGAAGEYLSQRSQYGGVENGGKILTAAGGGALAGGLAGTVLGTGAGAGVATTIGEFALVGAAASVIGGLAERRADEALGYSGRTDTVTELERVGIDALGGGLSALGGGKAADKLIPIPNVRRQIEILKFAARRSTRPGKIADAQRDAELRALANSTGSGALGGTIGVGIMGIRSIFDWFFTPPPAVPTPPTQVCTTSSFNGQELGGECKPLNP